MFSVIIPTLQRTSLLGGLLTMYSAHPVVDEILVINNSDDPLQWTAEKVRVITPGGNIFVNPAWNLGVRESTSSHLIISNDDLAFAPGVLDLAADAFAEKKVGIIGPHSSAFGCPEGTPRVTPTYERNSGFGTLMFMERSNYVPIPEELKIWAGDNWLFWRQPRRNYCMKGVRIETPMSATLAGSASFREQARYDRALYFGRFHDPVNRRSFPVPHSLALLARARRGVVTRGRGLVRQLR